MSYLRTALIGYTGFVGTNLTEQYSFTDLYNSKNFKEMKNQTYDLVVCSGISAAMWLANQNPVKDLELIDELLKVLKTIKTKQFVLISSVAVYKFPFVNINEDSQSFEDELAYGKHRRYAEQVIEKIFKKSLIIRLPALFGNNLKKNFIYDLMNQEPAFLTKDKLDEIVAKLTNDEAKFLSEYYIFDNNKNMFSFAKEEAEKNNTRGDLLKLLAKADFTALKFTHSESVYQFYSLSNLWKDINIALDNNIKELNISSEPLKASELAKEFFSIDLKNDNGREPFAYDIQTKYAFYWGKNNKYQYSRKNIFKELKIFFNKN